MSNVKCQRFVIITGGSRGIGNAIARAFLGQDAKVLIIARDSKELQDARKALSAVSPRVYTLAVDVSKEIGHIGEFIKKEFDGHLDVLVNAAGIYGPKGELENNDFEEWKHVFEVNVFGTVQMCRLALPFMKKKHFGRIINFSGGGEGTFPRFTAYSSSKGAIVRFTESLAEEVKEHGITVNAIAPGAVNTGLMEEVLKAGPQNVGKDFYTRSLAQKKSGGVSPEKAAKLILYLASPEARFITGKMLSAVHDKWNEFGKHRREIEYSDVYNLRRIKPGDRGYEW